MELWSRCGNAVAKCLLLRFYGPFIPLRLREGISNWQCVRKLVQRGRMYFLPFLYESPGPTSGCTTWFVIWPAPQPTALHLRSNAHLGASQSCRQSAVGCSSERRAVVSGCFILTIRRQRLQTPPPRRRDAIKRR